MVRTHGRHLRHTDDLRRLLAQEAQKHSSSLERREGFRYSPLREFDSEREESFDIVGRLARIASSQYSVPERRTRTCRKRDDVSRT